MLIHMILIVLLILLGVLFLIAEVVLLPGLTIGSLLSLACYGSAAYIAFDRYGIAAGACVLAIIALLSLTALFYSLRAKTWQRFSLRQRIESSNMSEPIQDQVRIGDRGISVSRLAPMGKVEIGNRTFEAKSADAFIDQRCEIEVVGFENANIVVKKRHH